MTAARKTSEEGSRKGAQKGPQKGAKSPARKTARAARPTTEWEIRCGYPGVTVAGVDEVGRGCLAGPVTAGAVILPAVIDLERDPWLKEVTDSKCLSPEKREELAPLIARWALASAVASATVEEIDRLNIYHASHLAMCRAIEKLEAKPSHILIDGNRVPTGLPCPGTAVVKGDLKCLSVAAASILAKVWRDRAMVELDARYPGYGFAIHKGYSTPAHSAALRAQGPCEIHRRSFAPVALQLQSSLGF